MSTLEQHLAAHGVGDLGGRRIVCMCGWESVPATYDDAVAQHAAHVAATWREARTITTVEQLDTLPSGAIYVSDAEGLAEQKAGDVWFAARCAEPFEPALPGVVVWTPEDGEA